MLALLALLSLAVWIHLAFLRGSYWRLQERLDAAALPAADADTPSEARAEAWADGPAVAAVIPARDEADVLDRTLRSVLQQRIDGPLDVVLVDDRSGDGTADVAERVAEEVAAAGRDVHWTVVSGGERPPGWAPKVWAMDQGYREALRRGRARGRPPEFVWWTDADIEHDPGVLRALLDKARGDDLAQVSLMVELEVQGMWERLLIPAFVLFFAKLYPFAWVNDARRRTAAAAGGCILARAADLEAFDGPVGIRDAWIDDCALAARLAEAGRAHGRGIWLGTTRSARSVRAYGGLRGVWRMVARSAYTQLHHSPPALAGTVVGMVVIYLVPPLVALTLPLHGDRAAAALALPAWLVMGATAVPAYRLYRQPVAAALLLPVAGLLYTLMTIDSALQHLRGRGVAWKGRRRSARVA